MKRATTQAGTWAVVCSCAWQLLACGSTEAPPAASTQGGCDAGACAGGSGAQGGSHPGSSGQGGSASGSNGQGGAGQPATTQAGSSQGGSSEGGGASGGEAQGGESSTPCECSLGRECRDGNCTCPAGPSPDFCDGVGCVDLQTDADHCSQCGHPCPNGEVCNGGQCDCPSGKVRCGDACVDLASDSVNCGKCGAVCPLEQACAKGKCGCDDAALSVCSDGCKNLDADSSNCGECGHACAVGEVCEGKCQCTSGVYCGAVCEPANDDLNCGACGVSCPAGQSCKATSCECVGAGLTKCGQACVDAKTDEQHCGNCETACNPTEVCTDSKCHCSGATEKFCAKANACVDTKTDNENCGDCDHACSGNRVCAGGACQCPDPALGTPVRLTNNMLHDERPAAAWDGTHVGVAYLRQLEADSNSYNLRFALLNPNGSVVEDVALTSFVASDKRSVGTLKLAGNRDQVGITWNGSEYGIVFDELDLATSESTVRLTRVSSAGVASTAVTVGSKADVLDSTGPSIGWSVPNASYIVCGSFSGGQAYCRQVGAQGTNLGALSLMNTDFCNMALAVAPDGTSAVAGPDGGLGLLVRYLAVDGARVPPTDEQIAVDPQVAPESVWDGTTFDTVVANDTSGVNVIRRGSDYSHATLVPSAAGVHQYAVDAVWADNALALGTLVSADASVYKLDRFTLTAGDKSALPVKVGGTVVVASTVHGRPELVMAGSGKLLALWPDSRAGATTELYAAPLTIKSCP